MSDFQQGPGWWQASDGKWYPPEQAPGAAPTQPTAPPTQPPAFGSPTFQNPGTTYMGYGATGGLGAGSAPLAAWGDRVVAYILDVVIVGVALMAFFIVGLILAAVSDTLGAIVIIIGYLAVAAISLYIFYLQGEVGGTPGKRLTGLKVVREADGQVLGGGMGIVRQLAHFLDSLFCGIGYFLPLFDEKRQTIADKVMNTLVIRDQPKMPFGPDLFKK
ncbi:MAG: RDD family protein [Acidimicrobiales bacterium]|nr:RDD family protein [Acidimicrobiales bacterium]